MRQVGGYVTANPWQVVEALQEAGHAQIARLLEDAAEMPLGRLIFPEHRGHLEPVGGPDANLVVITMPGVRLPDPAADPADVDRGRAPGGAGDAPGGALHVAVHLRQEPQHPKARRLGRKPLLPLLGLRAAPCTTASPATAARSTPPSSPPSQLPDDQLGEATDSLATAAFVGRLEDEATARKALKLLGVAEGAGYERTIMGLSRDDRGNDRPGEFLYRDTFGRVEKIRVDLDAYPHLLAALTTTPTGQRRRPNREAAA